MSRPVRVLVVDDDRAVRKALQVNLGKSGMLVTLAEGPEEALAALAESTQDIVLTDVKMPGGSGLDLLGQVRRGWPDLPVVVMTGYGSVADAVSAMKEGAADYLIKPIGKDELLVVLDRALERRSLQAEIVMLRQEVDTRYGFERLIGATPAMVALYEEIAAVADTRATVLLQGPTGTGKELLAHAIHQRSSRRNAPFVRVNCAAIPETLLESELFGHEKGAFTGAIRQHVGKFEQADGGTLLLDEIGEINPYVQVKLLRVLENGEIQRVGGTGTVMVDVRVVAATNRDLAQEVRERRFREDLYWRLNVVRLDVPALRDRREDIPLLVDHFLAEYAARNDRPVPRVTRRLMEKLCAYDWPGNVRQLEHLVERAVILERNAEIDDLRLPEEVTPGGTVSSTPNTEQLLPPVGVTLQDWLLRFEREVIVAALKEAGGVQAKAARRLGISRSNLNYRIGRLDLQVRGVDYD
ncbi:MAG: sigma-54-dependent Fis family transcriptional regulator [Alphaproteobacteria bacterium]|nr:sigma-54-dependent Fis family transcriptional regulator [Alphaproteobacteria bacterium]MCB9697783.1 sigma-54-dependent Fis family transcriptional regulator [Alphaproteobacteria bacterium]